MIIISTILAGLIFCVPLLAVVFGIGLVITIIALVFKLIVALFCLLFSVSLFNFIWRKG